MALGPPAVGCGDDADVDSPIWSTRSRALTLLGATAAVTGLVGLTWWLLHMGTDGAGIANVLALPAAVLGTAVAVAGLRSRPHADDPDVLAAQARILLDRVVAAEAVALQRLLGDTGDPRPADTTFTQVGVRWRTDGGATGGSLATVAAFYRGLCRGRLVVLGDGGAGKTVLTIQLLLDLAVEEHTVATSDPRARIRVPVRVSLPAFQGVERRQLDDWIAGGLVRAYGLAPPVAHSLVNGSWVLPILDGLDEMDLEQSSAVVAALNVPAGIDRWPVVLTCRTTRYNDLVRTARALQDATAITMLPLDVDQIVAWLAHHFPDLAQRDDIQRRWAAVVQRMRRHPAGRLAKCLSSPLWLFLAVTAYRRSGSRPSELCGLAADELETHLFARLIPAATEQYPCYDPVDVERWLRTLADHLLRMATLNGSAVDLHLHELWRTTGHPARVRSLAVIATAVVVAGPLLVFFAYLDSNFRFDSQLLGGIMLAGYLTWVLILVLSSPSPSIRPPRRMNLRLLRTSSGLRQIALAVWIGLVIGVSSGFLVGLAVGWRYGLVTGVIGGLVFGVVTGLGDLQETAARPSAPMRRVLTRDLGITSAVGMAIALAVGVSVGSVGGWGAGLVAGLTSGLPIGLAAGLTGGLVVGLGDSPWPRYLLAVGGLARSGALPIRPARFLDWAYEAGFVRLAGTAVQFRHRDLQARLASRDVE